MKKSIAILSMALLAGNAFAADVLEAGTATAPKYYVIKANRGIPYVTYTATPMNNGGASTTLYRSYGVTEAAVWAVVPGTDEGTVKIYNYTTRNDENKAYMFSFVTKDGSEFVGAGNSGTATTGVAQDVYVKDNGNGSYGLALKTITGEVDGQLWGLDATGGTTQFLGNLKSANDDGTQWWFTSIDAADVAGNLYAINKAEMDAQIKTYSTSMAAYAAAVPWVAEDLNAGITALGQLEVSADYQAQIDAIWSEYVGKANSNLNTMFGGKEVAFQNLRRAANGKVNPFVAVGESNYPMAQSFETDPNAIFTLESTTVNEKPAYYMYNAATQTYYGANNVPVKTKEEATTITFILMSNSGFTGVNIITAENKAFNVDENGNPLTYWSGADGGSIWSILAADDESKAEYITSSRIEKLQAYVAKVPAAVANVLNSGIDDIKALPFTADLAEKAENIVTTTFATANNLFTTGMNGLYMNIFYPRGNRYLSYSSENADWAAVTSNESDNELFTIKTVEGGVVLYNPANNVYVGQPVVEGNQTNIQPTANESEALVFTVELNNNSGFYGEPFVFNEVTDAETGATRERALNMNLNAKCLHTYGKADGGSIFVIEEREAPTPVEAETTIDFNENSYGLTATNDNNAEYIKEFSCIEGPVKIELDATAGNGVRYWLYNGTPQLRLYNKSKLTISINKGQIKKIQIKGGSLNQCYVPTGFEKEEWPIPTASNTTYIPSEDNPIDDYSSATFTAGGTVQFNQIIVTYVGGVNWPDLADPELKIVGGETEFTVVLGEEFTAPEITKATTSPLTYTSTKTDVATVDEEGNVTIVGKGTTKITASVAKNDEFKAGSISYTLNVIKPLPAGTIYTSSMGTDFTFVNPEMPEVWKHDNTYGLKGTGYEYINWVAEAYAVSPEIAIPADTKATLYFEQAINYLKGNPIAENCNVVVREAGETEWTTIENAVTAPEADSWTFYANAPVDLTAYAGKTIQIGFKYNSTSNVACTWEINEIIVSAVDALTAAKAEAIAELTKYFAHIPGDHSLEFGYYTESIEECETVEAVTELLNGYLNQLASQFANNFEGNFFFAVGDKFGAYVKPETEGANSWQVVDKLSADAVFCGKRVNERRWMPWSETDAEGEEEPAARESNNEDAYILYNVKTGYYLGQPTAAGEAIPVVEEEAEAAYWFVKPINGQFAVADDSNENIYLFWDETKGLIASETAATFPVDEIPVWDNGKCDYYVSIVVPTDGVDGGGRPVADKISDFDVYVSAEAELTGIGGIQCYSYDYETDEKVVYVNITAAQLAELTPEKATGIYKKTVGWGAEGPVYEEIEFAANCYHVTIKNQMSREEGEEESGITAPGDYYFDALEGTWIVSDETEGDLFSPETHEQVSIIGEVEPGAGFGIESDPVAGTVEELSSIRISPENGFCTIVWTNPVGTNITLTSGETVIEYWTPDDVLKAAVEKVDEWNDPDIFELKLDEPITAAGTYTLYIPEGFFEDETGKNAETFITWTIEEGEDGISNITVNGVNTIYDLQGRRVNNTAKGMLIINGQKVLVK